MNLKKWKDKQQEENLFELVPDLNELLLTSFQQHMKQMMHFHISIPCF